MLSRSGHVFVARCWAVYELLYIDFCIFSPNDTKIADWLSLLISMCYSSLSHFYLSICQLLNVLLHYFYRGSYPNICDCIWPFKAILHINEQDCSLAILDLQDSCIHMMKYLCSFFLYLIHWISWKLQSLWGVTEGKKHTHKWVIVLLNF